MAVVIFLLASTDDIGCLQLLEDIMHTSNNKNCLQEVIEGLPQPAYRGDLTPEERATTFSEILQSMNQNFWRVYPQHNLQKLNYLIFMIQE